MLDKATKAVLLSNLEKGILPKDEEGLRFLLRQTRQAVMDNTDHQINAIDIQHDEVLGKRLDRLKKSLLKVINPREKAKEKQRKSDFYLNTYA